MKAAGVEVGSLPLIVPVPVRKFMVPLNVEPLRASDPEKAPVARLVKVKLGIFCVVTPAELV